MKHILRSTMFQIKPTECKMLSSKITTLYFNMKWDPFLIIVLLNYLKKPALYIIMRLKQELIFLHH